MLGRGWKGGGSGVCSVCQAIEDKGRFLLVLVISMCSPEGHYKSSHNIMIISTIFGV